MANGKKKTINISEKLHKKLKGEATEKGISLQELIEEKLNGNK